MWFPLYICMCYRCVHSTDLAVNTITTLRTATSLVDHTPLTGNESVLSLPQIIIIFISIINFTIVSDIVPVLEATVEVTDWYCLGLRLDLPVHQLDTIRRDGYDETDRKCKMILKWMDTGVASWSCLVEALKSPLINKNGVAHRITKDHPRTCKYIT